VSAAADAAGDATAAVEVSTDPARLDLDRVHDWLSTQAYWALGRERATTERALRNSVAFGAYDAGGGGLLGIARLVTDGATFGWLCDVFVDPASRGRGVGKALVAAVRAEAERLGLLRLLLITKDAHGLYAGEGFRPLPAPEKWMIREGAGAW